MFSLNSVTKKIKNQKGGLQGWDPGPPVQERDCRVYHSATEPQATEQILILNPIHASVISQIL